MCIIVGNIIEEGCCVGKLYFLVEIGTVRFAEGGPHNIEVKIGATVISELILEGLAGETRLFTIDLNATIVNACIRQEDIDRIYFRADSTDGLYIERVAVFDRLLFDVDLNYEVNSDNINNSKVKVYEQQ